MADLDQTIELDAPPHDDEVKSILDKIKQARSTSLSPGDTSTFDQAEKDAQDLYNQRADRAEWLSLADRVGNAVTRMAAANSGLKSGVDLSHIDYGPGYDQKAALDRAGKDFGMSLERTGRQRTTQTEADKLKREQSDREAEGLAKDYDFAKYKYGQGTDTYQQGLKDKEANQRRKEELAFQGAREDKRDLRSENRLEQEKQHQSTVLKAKDLQDQLKTAQQDADAASQAAQILSSSDDLSKKNAEKLMATYPTAMAKAGITPEQMSSIQERATKKGLFWDNIDPKERQRLINEELIKPKQEQVRNLRQALDNLIGGKSTPDQPPTIAAQGVEPTDDMVKKYTSMYPSVSPDQAKDILKRRLNGGK